MKWPRSALILFVLLGFSVSLAVPAQDVAETVYDESEGLPYQAISQFSILGSQPSARLTKATLNCGSVPRFSSLTERCMRRCENNVRRHFVPDLLIILNHSLRC
jgi:hypothetical protein